MSVTLLELRTQSRDRADMTNSNFIEDSELNVYINNAIAELHDLLISAYSSDYYINTEIFSTVTNQTDYPLPADFYKLRGIDAQVNVSDWYTVRPFNFNERNRNDSMQWGLIGGPTIRYRLIGSNVVFSPKPDGIYQVRLWYTPVAIKLVADSDSLNDLNQYADFITTVAAIKMLQKEESDPSSLFAQKAELQKRIVEMAQNRDIGEPEAVSDIYAENNDYYFYRNG